MKHNDSLIYDVDGLVAEAKKDLRNSIVKISIAAVVLTLSILAIVFFGSYMLVFIGGIVLACISAFLGSKLLRKFVFSDYSSACGEIVDVHKDVKTVDTKVVGGIGLGQRKYDSYKKSEVRLGVFIQDGEQVRSYFFNDGTEEHAKYYEAKGEAIHIWGTHFPVRLEIAGDKWLCPVCGEFNFNREKTCTRCKKKIINKSLAKDI